MLGLLFLFMAVATGVYFAVLKPRIDAFTFAYGGSLFYMSPAFNDTGYAIGGPYPISDVTQLLGICLFIALMFADKLIPRCRFEVTSQSNWPEANRVQQYHLHVLIGFTTVLFLILFGTVGLEAFGAAKGSVQKPPFTDALFRVSLTLSIVASVISRHRQYTALVVCYLAAFLVIFQVRSTVAYSVAPALLFYFRDLDLSAKMRLVYAIPAGIFALLLLLFDKTKGSLLQGDFSILFNKKPYLDMYFNNNAQVFVQIFELTIQNGYRIEQPVQYLAASVFSVVPLSTTIFGVPEPVYGDYIIPNFLPNRTNGIASNIWAEAYAIAGVFGIVAAILLYFGGLSLISANLDSDVYFVRLIAYTISGYFAVHLLVLPVSSITSVYIMILSVIVFATLLPAAVLAATGPGIKSRSAPADG